MKLLQRFTSCIIALFILFSVSQVNAANDSLRLGEAYVNLSLTKEFFDSISDSRLNKILSFESKELNEVRKSVGPKDQSLLYFSYSLLQYIKANKFYQKQQEPDRRRLMNLKNVLSSSMKSFESIKLSEIEVENSFYDFIKLDEYAYNQHARDIDELKKSLTPNFNRDIYPDFKRILLAAKNDKQYKLDSLEHYSRLYNLKEDWEKYEFAMLIEPYEVVLTKHYNRAIALDLIAKYVRFDAIANGIIAVADTLYMHDEFEAFTEMLQPGNDEFQYSDGIIVKDQFFKEHLDKKTINLLQKKLQKRYPKPDYFRYTDNGLDGIGFETGAGLELYYFPIPAPAPTAKKIIPRFKPALKTLGEVNRHIQKSLEAAGYEDRLHYFYIKEKGFAVTTAIERINKDGSPVEGIKRWDLSAETGEELSLYNVFRAMFFKTESDYRLIACIVSKKEVKTQKESSGLGEMNNFLENSYSSLPPDLEEIEMIDKTISILLYHYTQDDVGAVPKLNQNTILTVRDHINKTPSLSSLLNN